MTGQKPDTARTGRRIALLIAGTGLGWIIVNAIGASLGWSPRMFALFDLAAAAAFGWALWLIYGLWRARQEK